MIFWNYYWIFVYILGYFQRTVGQQDNKNEIVQTSMSYELSDNFEELESIFASILPQELSMSTILPEEVLSTPAFDKVVLNSIDPFELPGLSQRDERYRRNVDSNADFTSTVALPTSSEVSATIPDTTKPTVETTTNFDGSGSDTTALTTVYVSTNTETITTGSMVTAGSTSISNSTETTTGTSITTYSTPIGTSMETTMDFSGLNPTTPDSSTTLPNLSTITTVFTISTGPTGDMNTTATDIATSAATTVTTMDTTSDIGSGFTTLDTTAAPSNATIVTTIFPVPTSISPNSSSVTDTTSTFTGAISTTETMVTETTFSVPTNVTTFSTTSDTGSGFITPDMTTTSPNTTFITTTVTNTTTEATTATSTSVTTDHTATSDTTTTSPNTTFITTTFSVSTGNTIALNTTVTNTTTEATTATSTSATSDTTTTSGSTGSTIDLNTTVTTFSVPTNVTTFSTTSDTGSGFITPDMTTTSPNTTFITTTFSVSTGNTTFTGAISTTETMVTETTFSVPTKTNVTTFSTTSDTGSGFITPNMTTTFITSTSGSTGSTIALNTTVTDTTTGATTATSTPATTDNTAASDTTTTSPNTTLVTTTFSVSTGNTIALNTTVTDTTTGATTATSTPATADNTAASDTTTTSPNTTLVTTTFSVSTGNTIASNTTVTDTATEVTTATSTATTTDTSASTNATSSTTTTSMSTGINVSSASTVTDSTTDTTTAVTTMFTGATASTTLATTVVINPTTTISANLSSDLLITQFRTSEFVDATTGTFKTNMKTALESLYNNQTTSRRKKRAITGNITIQVVESTNAGNDNLSISVNYLAFGEGVTTKLALDAIERVSVTRYAAVVGSQLSTNVTVNVKAKVFIADIYLIQTEFNASKILNDSETKLRLQQALNETYRLSGMYDIIVDSVSRNNTWYKGIYAVARSSSNINSLEAVLLIGSITNIKYGKFLEPTFGSLTISTKAKPINESRISFPAAKEYTKYGVSISINDTMAFSAPNLKTALEMTYNQSFGTNSTVQIYDFSARTATYTVTLESNGVISNSAFAAGTIWSNAALFNTFYGQGFIWEIYPVNNETDFDCRSELVVYLELNDTTGNYSSASLAQDDFVSKFEDPLDLKVCLVSLNSSQIISMKITRLLGEGDATLKGLVLDVNSIDIPGLIVIRNPGIEIIPSFPILKATVPTTVSPTTISIHTTTTTTATTTIAPPGTSTQSSTPTTTTIVTRGTITQASTLTTSSNVTTTTISVVGPWFWEIVGPLIGIVLLLVIVISILLCCYRKITSYSIDTSKSTITQDTSTNTSGRFIQPLEPPNFEKQESEQVRTEEEVHSRPVDVYHESNDKSEKPEKSLTRPEEALIAPTMMMAPSEAGKSQRIRTTIHPVSLPPIRPPQLADRFLTDLVSSPELRQRADIERHRNKQRMRKRNLQKIPHQLNGDVDPDMQRAYADAQSRIDDVLSPFPPAVFNPPQRKRPHKRTGMLDMANPAPDPDLNVMLGPSNLPPGQYTVITPQQRAEGDPPSTNVSNSAYRPDDTRERMKKLLEDAFSLVSPRSPQNSVAPEHPPITHVPSIDSGIYPSPPLGAFSTPEGFSMPQPHGRGAKVPKRRQFNSPPASQDSTSAGENSPLFTRRHPPLVHDPEADDDMKPAVRVSSEGQKSTKWQSVRPLTYHAPSSATPSGKDAYITPIRKTPSVGNSLGWSPYRAFDEVSQLESELSQMQQRPRESLDYPVSSTLPHSAPSPSPNRPGANFQAPNSLLNQNGDVGPLVTSLRTEDELMQREIRDELVRLTDRSGNSGAKS